MAIKMITIIIIIMKLHKNDVAQVFPNKMVQKMDNVIFIILQSKQFMAHDRDN